MLQDFLQQSSCCTFVFCNSSDVAEVDGALHHRSRAGLLLHHPVAAGSAATAERVLAGVRGGAAGVFGGGAAAASRLDEGEM